MAMITPKSYYDETIGKKIDTDNYPRSNPFQCWDYFDFFCRKVGFTGSRYCASTGYVGDLWMLRDAQGYEYYRDFDYITDPAQFQDGDWIFWSQHVAMYYNGMEVGQNQMGKPYVTAKEMNWNGILGAMRYKHWSTVNIKYGASDVEINGHLYHLYRATPNDKPYVLGAGLNKVKTIRELDADILVYAKVGGANYFQMKDNQSDPKNTTYGDISAPLNGEYQTLPNQDTTLFYDLETGEFGDCTFVEIDPTHNVYSPVLVYPNAKGHWEYARMVGLGHKDTKNMYSFVIRFNDGYCLGLADKEMTPQEIANDFVLTDMINIAFLDGGGSAQGGRWVD